jgi:hypothetical protein
MVLWWVPFGFIVGLFLSGGSVCYATKPCPPSICFNERREFDEEKCWALPIGLPWGQFQM